MYKDIMAGNGAAGFSMVGPGTVKTFRGAGFKTKDPKMDDKLLTQKTAEFRKRIMATLAGALDAKKKRDELNAKIIDHREKSIFWREQAESCEAGAKDLLVSIRRTLSSGGDPSETMKTISRLQADAEAAREFAGEIEKSILPSKLRDLAQSERLLLGSIRGPVAKVRDEVSAEIDERATAIERDLVAWSKAVEAIDREMDIKKGTCASSVSLSYHPILKRKI